MTPVSVTGMVLSAMPIGDYDKRLVILTREKGKITAFAKGARKQNSALLACSQPFSFGNFMIYEGRSAYTVMSAEISNYFTSLREDLTAVAYAMYFCELAIYFSRENVDGTDTLKLLYQTLKILSKKTIPFELIQYIVELKMLSIHGLAPQVFDCVKCRNTQNLTCFSANQGGIVCSNCISKTGDSITVETSTIYAMQFIITSSIEKLYTFNLKKEVLKELKMCMKRFFAAYVDYEFKSLDMLDVLKDM